MRMLRLLVLICAFPVIALSQIQPDKAILAGYAHPSFVQMLHASVNKHLIDTHHQLYLAASDITGLFQRTQQGFTVVRQLSPTHAIIQLDPATFNDKAGAFKYLLPANNAWKVSPGLLQMQKKGTNVMRLVAGVKNVNSFKSALSKHVRIVSEYASANVLIIQLDHAAAFTSLLDMKDLLFVDAAQRIPREELIVSGFDLSTNHINTLHHHFPVLTGEGLILSLKENRFDTTDIDLKGRIVYSDLASSSMSGHASIMATMAAGAGNSFYEGKGVAWKANLQSVTFANLLPEPDTYYNSQNIAVQNHSYGTGIENYYGADAAAYDASVINKPSLLHVFSAGNSGLAVSAGPYAGITGFANLTGSFKMAKNNLVVGAIDSVGNIEVPVSKGPAYDGRIKPELVSFGQDGSSGAAAIVSGISLLLQQAYQQQHGSLPAAALVKTILINSADDVGAPGPDFASGYGKANAYKAMRTIQESNFFSNNIQQGNTQTFALNIPAGLKKLKLTLGWSDQPAQANAVKALVNDLDLELTHVPSGQTFQPWILNAFAHKDSLLLLAKRGKDTANNVEQITLDAPPAGNYVIRVTGSRILNSSQQYFIAYGADTLNKFEWMYPMMADPVIAGTGVLLRWDANFNAGTTGSLEYSLNGNTWQNISSNVDLSKNYLRWNAPDVFSTAMLRITINGNTYSTETFVLSKRINTEVGFNCTDSFLFYWNKPSGVNSFKVYRRGDKFMEPIITTNDAFYIGAKNTALSRQYTIAPVVNGREGIRAYAFDYASQGVECYIKSFLTQLNIDKAALQLQLGSVYRVSKLVLQKFSANKYVDLQVINSPNALSFDFEDVLLHQGLNTYRIALQLNDGTMIYSRAEVVYYLANTNYIIYPNPAPAAGSFRILQKEPATIRVSIYDAAGRMVKREDLADVVNIISTASLQKGLYVVVIEKEGVVEYRGKVIIGR